MSRLAPLMSSAKDDWQTPDNILELVRRVAPIGLDPCTTAENPCQAHKFYTPAEDGLKFTWDVPADYLVYVNPPYGRGIGKWIQHCAHSGGPGRRNQIIALVPARTDTKWWHSAKYDAVCFWRGRLTFRGAPSVAPFPSALLYWGRNLERERFIHTFSLYGQVFRNA